MGKIVSIADQTNILAINASIEAARAGAAGRGFRGGGGQVKSLAKEIKVLANEVDTGVCDVGEQRQPAQQQHPGIPSRPWARGGHCQPYRRKPSGRSPPRPRRGGRAVGDLRRNRRIQQELQVIRQFFDQIKEQYQEVLKHIEFRQPPGHHQERHVRGTWIT